MRPRPTGIVEPTAGPVVGQAGTQQAASIESLRAVGAIGVLVCHVYLMWWYAAGAEGGGPLHLFLVTIGSGYALLLVLSGYLLFRPFARRLLRGEPSDLRRYARNRALRVLPLYYVAVPLLLLTTAPPLGWELWVVLLTMTGNFVPGSYRGVNSPLLVLLVEVQFYVLLPVLVALLRRRPSMRFAASVVGVLSLASVAARLVILELGDLADPERFVRASVLTMFHLFGAGMLLALLALRLEDPARRPSGWVGSAWVWLLGSVAVWLVMLVTQIELLSGVASALLLGAVALPLRPSPLVAALSWRPLALVGLTTFSLYMWHLPITEVVASSGWAPRGVGGFLVVCLALVAVVSLVSYALIEAPALSLRRPWASRGPDDDVQAASTRTVLVRVALGATVIGLVLAGLAAHRADAPAVPLDPQTASPPAPRHPVGTAVARFPSGRS